MSTEADRSNRELGGSRGGERRSGKRTPGQRAGGGRRQTGRRRGRTASLVMLAIAGLAVIFLVNNSGGDKSEGGAGEYRFQVGDPGPGSQAPRMKLPSTGGEVFDLASLKGKKVLLYFQEGLMCQPCWDQIVDIEKQFPKFTELGIEQIVSITTDPVDDLRRKVQDEGISTPILSDPDLRVSRTYKANLYGMMGSSMNGHTFVLVDEQGVIGWRADYGGAPDNYMYIPVSNLLADMRAGLASQS